MINYLYVLDLEPQRPMKITARKRANVNDDSDEVSTKNTAKIFAPPKKFKNIFRENVSKKIRNGNICNESMCKYYHNFLVFCRFSYC